MYDFTGQTVLVTGGTRGIGRGIVEAFLAAGATVVASYVGNEAAAAALVEEHPEAGDRLHTVRFDVANPEAVAAFFET